MMRAKNPRAYYLDGLPVVFRRGVHLPGPLCADQRFTNAAVCLLNPGPDAVEVLGILDRFPDIHCLHIIEPTEHNLDTIRSEIERTVGVRWKLLPAMAGYVTDISRLPEELAGRCDLVVEINVIDPKADRASRQDALRGINRLLKPGGLFYSGGETIRWTDGVVPPDMLPVLVGADILERVGYSDALPRPMLFLKQSSAAPGVNAEDGNWRRWWKRGQELLGRRTTEVEDVRVEVPFVPRVEDGRGDPNVPPWNFLITKPAVRRPAMNWVPKDGDRFGTLTLGRMLQLNPNTGMHVFRVRECPGVVLKLMQPFEGDIPDDPLEWNSLRKSKTLKRENGALTVLKGVRFIPQRIAHGYDPATGWYAIVVEFESSRTLRHFIDGHHDRLHRRHETAADVRSALAPMLMLLNSLAFIHARGMVHLDLKPEHVFLRPASNEAVLIDWGLSRKIDEPLSEESRSGSWIHAPPERLDLNVLASAEIHQDLYAVGVMFLQLATDLNLDDRPRFLINHFFKHGCMPTAAEIETILRPRWKWAASVIARAIKSRVDLPGYADQRYASAADMADDIRRSHASATAACGGEAPFPSPDAGKVGATPEPLAETKVADSSPRAS